MNRSGVTGAAAAGPPSVAVLGEVEVRDGEGRVVALPPQRREIVAALAARAGSVVARHDLVVALWGDDTPAAHNRLKSQIAQLRPALDPRLTIEHDHHGYRLVGPLELFDTTRFERLVAGARDLPPELAVERYREALDQWRSDEPFVGITNHLVDPAVWRLVTLRDQAVMALADGDLARARPSAATPYLERMFADDPTRGDVAGRLAALSALASRQVDGLRVVQRHRDALADLGAVVAPDVAAVESRILRHDLVPAPAPATAGVPASSTPSVWLTRPHWRSLLDESIERGAVVLSGEPGVGRTSMVEVLAARHLARGTTVIRTAVQAEPTRPMHVVLDVVDQMRHLLPARLERALERPGATAALARASGGAARTPGHVSSRDELIVDLTTLLADVLDGTGALLVVEDAHWLDSTTAEVVAALLGRARPRTLVTARTPVPDALLAAGAITIELPAFSADEVQDLLVQALPVRADRTLAAEVLAQTGGNPLFVRLAIDVLVNGQLGADVPSTVHEAVRDRTSGLSRTTRDALQLAALLGREFELAPLRQLRPRIVDALRDAASEGLLRLHDDRGAFVHGLVADALVADVAAGTRIALHDELCRALQATGAPAMRVASHALGAAPLDPARAVRACLDAARDQTVVFEWNDALVWTRRGLGVTEQYGLVGSAHEAHLRALAGIALRRVGQPDSDRELLRAAELAEERGEDDLLVRVVTELCLHGQTSRVGSTDERALAHLDRALAVHTDDVAHVELLAAAATLMGLTEDAARARHHYLEARTRALRSGDDQLVRTVLLNAHLGLAHPDDQPLRRHAAATLAAMDDVDARWESHYLHVGIGLVDADRTLVEQSVRSLRELTPEVRERGRRNGALQVESAYAHLCGRLDLAEEAANQAFARGLETYSESLAMSVYAALLLPIREAQRREAELWEPVSGLLRRQPDFVTWQALACVLATARGDRPAARRLLGALRERHFAFAPDLTFTAVATVVCRAVWYLGDREAAEELLEVVRPFAGRMSWNGLATHGPVDAGLAALEATLGRSERCDEHRLTATLLVARLAAPHLLWPEFDRLRTR